MTTIILLTISNIFMTFAWYGHLKYRQAPLFKVILISWVIAFAEYCFQVPANRIGSYEFTAAQLKTIQEVITLTVFSIFSILYLKEPLRWNYAVGFVMIVAAVADEPEPYRRRLITVGRMGAGVEHEDPLMSVDEGLRKAVAALKECIVTESAGPMHWA